MHRQCCVVENVPHYMQKRLAKNKHVRCRDKIRVSIAPISCVAGNIIKAAVGCRRVLLPLQVVPLPMQASILYLSVGKVAKCAYPPQILHLLYTVGSWCPRSSSSIVSSSPSASSFGTTSTASCLSRTLLLPVVGQVALVAESSYSSSSCLTTHGAHFLCRSLGTGSMAIRTLTRKGFISLKLVFVPGD